MIVLHFISASQHVSVVVLISSVSTLLAGVYWLAMVSDFSHFRDVLPIFCSSASKLSQNGVAKLVLS